MNDVKICSKCSTEKPIEEFSKRTLNSGKVISQSWCKQCSKTHHAKYFKDNQSTYQDKNKARVKNTTEFIRSLKDRPCADCGNKYPPYVMDFDHLGKKTFMLGKAANLGFSKDKILLEAEKCEVVCSNCHRERTEQRRRLVMSLSSNG